MQSDQGAREIAEKLTKRQQRALDGYARLQWLPVQVWKFETPVLIEHGLGGGGYDYRFGGHPGYLVTDLGRAVASHLQRKSPS